MVFCVYWQESVLILYPHFVKIFVDSGAGGMGFVGRYAMGRLWGRRVVERRTLTKECRCLTKTYPQQLQQLPRDVLHLPKPTQKFCVRGFIGDFSARGCLP